MIKSPDFIKVKSAVFWNYMALVVFGACGLLIVSAIAYFYGASTLGYFNLINAIYIILSQIVSIGIHNSVLMHLSREQTEVQKKEILFSALVLGAIIDLPLVLIVYHYSDVFSKLFHGNNVSFGLKMIAPALFFFSLNKIMMWALNALGNVRAYAFSQALRYVCMLVVVLLVSIIDLNEKWLVINFIVSEIVLFLYLSLTLISMFGVPKGLSFRWTSEHMAYGIKGIASGLFLTLNLNIDVVILGMYVSQRTLGIYSFAATIVIGLYHLLTAVRVSFNPTLANYLASDDHASIGQLIKVSRRYVFLGMSVISILVLLVTPLLIIFFMPDRQFLESWPLLCVLLIGVLVYSLFFPFDQMLAMAGYPGVQTLFNLTVLSSNVVLCFLCIRTYGVVGAALATTIVSTLIAPFTLWFLIKYFLRIDIVKHTYMRRGVQF